MQTPIRNQRRGIATAAEESRLEALRREIDRVSIAIVDLLNERTRYALEVAEEKRRHAMPMRDPHRETQLIAMLTRRSRGPLDPTAVGAVFRQLIDATVVLMERGGRF